MDEEYDAIVLGTGLKECILSGLLSVDGLKVLHMDRNDYYGGETASLNLKQLWDRFRQGQQPPAALGASRDYNVDLVPKFIMGNGKLVRVLVHTDVTKYLEFKAVDGSYVLSKGRVEKVPATDMEALKSNLMGLFEKRRARSFFQYVQNYDDNNIQTHKGHDLQRMTMDELYKVFGLDVMTIDFIGHALALYRDDAYMQEPAYETVKRVKLYYDSLMRFEGTKSPYIYPLYGLGELPQAFARLSAVYGGTYMLNKPDVKVVYEDGKAVGVESEGQVAKAKMVIGDPSYFPGEPRNQTSTSFCCSYTHNVVAKGKWIAFVSTTVETNDPESELRMGLAILGAIDEKFVEVTDVHEPLDDGKHSRAFISKGYDATSHFETTVDDVLEMYTRITGKILNLDSKDVAQTSTQ